MTGKRVVISGAGGFVGANLVRSALSRGGEVHALVRPGSSDWRLREVENIAHVHTIDLLHGDNLLSLMRDIRPHWVVHTASHGAYSWQEDADRILAVNVLGTSHLLTAALAAGVEVFVNTGSSSEYGLKDHPPAEDEPLSPNSVYAVGKASASLLCQHLAEREHAYIPTLRLYSVYGPWEEPRRFIPTLIRAARAGRLPDLADPRTARDFVFVGDVVEAYFSVLQGQPKGGVHGPVYNVGSGRQRTLAEVVAEAREVFGISEEPRWQSLPSRPWDTLTWVANPERIGREHGWRAKVGFREGLLATALWQRRAQEPACAKQG